MWIKFGMLYELPFHDCLMKHMKEVSIDTNRITLVVLSSKPSFNIAVTVKELTAYKAKHVKEGSVKERLTRTFWSSLWQTSFKDCLQT